MGSYAPWVSRFMRYVDGKKDQGIRINRFILDGPFKLGMIPTSDSPTDAPILRPQTYSDLTGDDKFNYEDDIDAMSWILLGIPNDIYNSLDSCSTAQQMWTHVQRTRQQHTMGKVEYDVFFDYLAQNELDVKASNLDLANISNTFLRFRLLLEHVCDIC
ncbi:hypothetical protein Tco_1264731 [Tanacetum coccineum]